MAIFRKLRQRHIKIILSAILFIVGLILQNTIEVSSGYIWLAVYLPAYLIVGYDTIFKAIRNIFKGNFLDENFLMSIATIGAFVIGEYPEGVAVMLFYQIGEIFQDRAVGKSRKAISELMDIRPDYANLKTENGENTVSPFDVKVGDTIIVKAGEKIPLDAVVTKGETSLNTSMLTGESLPKAVSAGDEILSGMVNIDGVIEAKVTKEFGESTASKILDLVENAGNNKSKSENFITKFARIYTPIVVISALLLAVIPPIFDGLWQVWVYRALTFLVVSCPCALVISVPLSFFGGIGNASKNGILIKGGNYIDGIAKINTIAFDKTGTLTKGNFKVKEINAVIDKQELLEMTAYAESQSTHPIAKSIVSEYNKPIDHGRINAIKEIAGGGIEAIIDGKSVLVGNQKLMTKYGIDFNVKEDIGTVIYVAIDKRFAGSIVVADEIKPEAKIAIDKLNNMNIRTIMLTGDNDKIGKAIAKELCIGKVYTELLPTDKVEKVEEILAEKNTKLAFVGDGINDAPVIKRADIGIAMGGVGSDSAIEASDIVLMTDEPTKIIDTIKLARYTIKIANENIWFSIIIKVAVLVLSALGMCPMWLAIFADVGVAIIATLNAIRTLNHKLK